MRPLSAAIYGLLLPHDARRVRLFSALGHTSYRHVGNDPSIQNSFIERRYEKTYIEREGTGGNGGGGTGGEEASRKHPREQ